MDELREIQSSVASQIRNSLLWLGQERPPSKGSDMALKEWGWIARWSPGQGLLCRAWKNIGCVERCDHLWEAREQSSRKCMLRAGGGAALHSRERPPVHPASAWPRSSTSVPPWQNPWEESVSSYVAWWDLCFQKSGGKELKAVRDHSSARPVVDSM